MFVSCTLSQPLRSHRRESQHGLPAVWPRVLFHLEKSLHRKGLSSNHRRLGTRILGNGSLLLEVRLYVELDQLDRYLLCIQSRRVVGVHEGALGDVARIVGSMSLYSDGD